MPEDRGSFRASLASQTLRNNDSSSNIETTQKPAQPSPPPPPPSSPTPFPTPPPPPPPSLVLPPTFIAPASASLYCRRSSSSYSVSASSFNEIKRKVSGIWRTVSRLERDRERRKIEMEYERRRWEDQVDQRLYDGRRRFRDGTTRGRVRYIYPYEK
ncbi:hypothetical protein MMC22_002553 [Lobaria immixta]|nr:hypothetical protein [Lobaria immixta]